VNLPRKPGIGVKTLSLRWWPFLFVLLLFSLEFFHTVPSLIGAETEPHPNEARLTPGPRKGRGYDMDYGSALSYTINCKKAGSSEPENLVLKGVAVKLGQDASICFDTERLRYAAGWTNGFLDIYRTHLNSSKGSDYAWIDGDLVFSTPDLPGWVSGQLSTTPSPIHYLGFYRDGPKITFAYTIDGVEIRDHPSSGKGQNSTFVRTLTVAAHTKPLWMLVGRNASADSKGLADSNAVHIAGQPSFYAVVQSTSGKTPFGFEQGPSNCVYLKVPPRAEKSIVRIQYSAAAPNADNLSMDSSIEDPERLCHGGEANWAQVVETAGVRGDDTSAYTVDSLVPPDNNPWHSWLRFTAFDFFSDGRAAIATWSGDVWVVSGIDSSLGHLRWKRYAAGLFEALGLRIIKDTVYVTSRDRIVRLHDLNGDGEADYYESFNADAPVGPSYHAFAFDLQTDSAGNFYYIRCGQRVDPALPLQGGIIRISPGGSESELIATGLRAANGMAIGPHDEIVCADNQGNWIPSSRLNWIKPGGFYGYIPQARISPPPNDFEKPLCWLPMAIDNSSGGQAWVTSKQWGPFENYLLHTSYGKGALFLVMKENIGEQIQGGVVQFPLRFSSGIMRARFNSRDGQLYVCGLQGWQTSGLRDGCFQRVRYTGKPVYMPSGVHVKKDGLEVSFTAALDATSAQDPQNYAVEAWNYRWTEAYGSPDFKLSRPAEQGHDRWQVGKVKLLEDKKTVSITLPDLQPAMQVRLQMKLRGTDSTPMPAILYSTINKIP
jgi:hypothetical protein